MLIKRFNLISNGIAGAFSFLGLAYILFGLPILVSMALGYEQVVCYVSMVVLFALETVVIVKLVSLEDSFQKKE